MVVITATRPESLEILCPILFYFFLPVISFLLVFFPPPKIYTPGGIVNQLVQNETLSNLFNPVGLGNHLASFR